MGTISINYDSVCREVKRLREISSELLTLQNNAVKTLNDINTYWEGAAVNAFMNANEDWRKEVKSLEKETASLAELIQKVADEIREAELRAEAAVKAAQLLDKGMKFFGNDKK